MKRISIFITVACMALVVMVSGGALQTAEAREARAASPLLSVPAREIDLGAIGPGERAKAQFQILNAGGGTLSWYVEAPAGWTGTAGGRPEGETGSAASNVEVQLISGRERGAGGELSVQMRILSGRGATTLRRDLAEGSYREALRIESDAGSRTLFVKFRITDIASRPAIEVEPRGIDLGDTEPVKEITRRIRITNGGAGMLKWQVSSGPGPAAASRERERGRYLSFFNEGLSAGSPYAAPPSLKEVLQPAGNWVAEKGYPRGTAGCALRLSYYGAGAVVYGRRSSENVAVRISVDDRPARDAALQPLEGDRFWFDPGEEHLEGAHSLIIQVEDGYLLLEGVFTADSRASVPPAAWIRLTPLTGTTTRETDFVSVRMTLSDFKPGSYTDTITVTSNGGTARIPVSVTVTTVAAPKILTIYRYVRGDDQLFTAQPEREDPNYLGAYQRSGLAFRLYSPQTAGTVELFRWYNPTIGDHYYSGERDGGRKILAGYLFEGPIGNIATIRLPGARELYRWFNPATGHHFFTTDASGEGMGRKGYHFEGIVGFVLR